MTDPPNDPVLPERSRDDQDQGWGADEAEAKADDSHTEWLRHQRPPHHGD